MINHKMTSGLLLAVILFFFACDDQDKLGLDLQRADQRLSTFVVDTFTVESSVKMVDTLGVSGNTTTRALVGTITDRKFGSANAMIFGSFLLPSTGITFLDDQKRPPILDSLTLTLTLQIAYDYGDTTQTPTIHVHRLTQPLLSTKTYYHTDNLPIGELLGSVTQKIKRGVILSIKLKNSLIREIIDREGTDDLKVQSAFDQFFKGIRISIEGAQNLALGIDPNSPNTNLTFRYKNELAGAYKAPAIFFTGTTGVGPLFSNIQFDFSQTSDLRKLEVNKLVPTAQLGNQGYIINGANVFTLLKFPSVYGFSQNKNVIVNRAELIIEPTPDNFEGTRTNQTIPNLQFVFANSNGNLSYSYSTSGKAFANYVPAEGSTSNNLVALTMPYLVGGRTFQPVIITSYIQGLMNKTIDNTGIFVVPQGFLTTNSVEKLAVGNHKSTTNPMKLVVYYTVIQR
jgi:hypothetical protein